MNQLDRLSCGKHISAELTQVIHRIKELYGDNLEVVSARGDWITIRARKITDTHFLKDLMDKKDQIFPKHKLNEFQVLCPWDLRSGKGIEIHYLGNTRNEYRPGYWWV